MPGSQPTIRCRYCGRQFCCQVCAACARHHTDFYQPSYFTLQQDPKRMRKALQEPQERAERAEQVFLSA